MSKNTLWVFDLATTTGWAVFCEGERVASGTFKLRQRTINKVKQPRAAKYASLFTLLDSSYSGGGPLPKTPSPDLIVYEVGGFYPSQASAELAHGLAAHLEHWAFNYAIPTEQILNWTVKRFACGSARASKADMIAVAKKLWPRVKIQDDNEADALLIGAAWLEGAHLKGTE